MNIINHPDIKLNMKYIEFFGNSYIYNDDFNCDNSYLTSLYGSPIIVRGNFYCHDNNLTSLKYGPVEVHGNFSCARNPLPTLDYCPKYVGGDFYCSKDLYNLLGKNYIESICKIKGFLRPAL